MAYAIRHQGQSSAASGLDVLAAIWLLISPFVLGFGNLGNAAGNNVILGIIIGILALIRLFNPVRTVGVSWLNVILGIWVIISPWVLGFDGNATAMTNNVIVGIIVIILAGWSALSTSPAANETLPPRAM
ncbi:MAG TPA: SPW repeat protein [Phycisphaerae bacterium]|jgi:hypothetical protein|nr:SPW repeat protein [Phycisphaerae bacterium]